MRDVIVRGLNAARFGNVEQLAADLTRLGGEKRRILVVASTDGGVMIGLNAKVLQLRWFEAPTQDQPATWSIRGGRENDTQISGDVFAAAAWIAGWLCAQEVE